MSTPRSPYFPNLDALRCFAAFAVILYHTRYNLTWPDSSFAKNAAAVVSLNDTGGFVGVSFFFVLSGFLITYLMFSEEHQTNAFSIPRFYLRRFLRIWPLYYASLVVGFLIYPYAASRVGIPHSEPPFWPYAIFASNFDHIYGGRGPQPGILGVQWSLGVEEQFYLVWPVLFYFLRRRPAFPFVVAAIVLGANVYRALHIEEGLVLYYHTICALNDLGIGALAAWFCYYRPEAVAAFFQRGSRALTAVVYVLGIVLVCTLKELQALPYLRHLSRLAPAIFFAYVIVEQNVSSTSVFKVSTLPIVSRLGKVSYGLYLLHMMTFPVVKFIGRRFSIPVGLQIVAIVIATIALAELSFRFIETPFLKIKNAFSPLLAGKPAATGAAQATDGAERR